MDHTETIGNGPDRLSAAITSRELMLKMPCAVYMTDAKGYLTFYNNAALALWGRKPVIGEDRWCGTMRGYNLHGDQVPLSQCPMAVALKEKMELPPQELVIERPDLSRRTVQAIPKPLFDESGDLIGGINILVDITEMRETEKALRTSEGKLKSLTSDLQTQVEAGMKEIIRQHDELKLSEERYHRMLGEVKDYAILLLDSDGIIRNWNAGAEKIKGYTENEIVGKHFRVFYTQEDQDTGLPETLIDEARRNGKAVHEGWRRRKDGGLFWGSIVITALHNDSGEIIGFSKVTRDLTLRKIAEDQQRRYANDLEFQNRELQQFAYAAAHDMKEPLRKLRFYNSSVMESLSGQLSEKEALYLNRSIEAAGRMQALIDDLLAYSTNTMQGETFAWVDLNTTMEEAMRNCQDMLEETGASLDTDPLPVLWGISFQLRQLFENLLSNAVKYRHPDRPPVIRITCERVRHIPTGKHPAHNAKADNPDGFFKLSFHDNGIGFEKDKAEKMFDIFQRLHSRSVIPGTGIGLAICKKVVQNHSGFIDGNGNPGEGAVFTIYLPVGTRPSDPSGTQPPDPAANGSTASGGN
jgi:PAS domain S-box-containing protein